MIGVKADQGAYGVKLSKPCNWIQRNELKARNKTNFYTGIKAKHNFINSKVKQIEFAVEREIAADNKARSCVAATPYTAPIKENIWRIAELGSISDENKRF